MALGFVFIGDEGARGYPGWVFMGVYSLWSAERGGGGVVDGAASKRLGCFVLWFGRGENMLRGCETAISDEWEGGWGWRWE